MEATGDRRARKKAQTRAEVRHAAHRLFAERGFEAVTIADVAEAADVALQTVFNHFATKEELYFDGRTPWVEDPARALLERTPGSGPIETLRRYIQVHIDDYPATVTREGRRYLEVLQDSPVLRAAEWRLFRSAERNLAEAVLQAWESEVGPSPRLRLAADLVAAQFLNVSRVLLVTQRRLLFQDSSATAEADLAAMTTAVLDAMTWGLHVLARAEGIPSELGTVVHLEPVAADQAESGPAGEPSTTGSSTSSTSWSTPSVDSGTANAV